MYAPAVVDVAMDCGETVQAPSEAEAQCCSMCKEGLVYGVATDDMDALTFGTPKLIRHLMAPGNNQKLSIDEFDYGTMLQQMEITPVCPHLRFCMGRVSLEY